MHAGVHGELVSTGMVKSVDNIPPMPVTKLATLNAGTSIQVTWNLSIDDDAGVYSCVAVG